jgi:2,5-diketo-D-gluconate reductase B
MPYVTAHGARIPALGFGTFRLEGRTAERMVAAALEIGYRHVDTAQMYGNEAEVGRGIAASRVPREEIWLTTKIWPDSFRDGVLQRATETSVRRLRTEPDLLLLHWPNPKNPMWAHPWSGIKPSVGARSRIAAMMRA